MKKVLFFAIAAILLISVMSCNKQRNPDCGDNNTFDIYLTQNSLLDSTTGIYYSYTDGNNRVFQWSELVTDVCPDEHVKVQFKVTLADAASAHHLIARARVAYGPLSEREFPMSLSGNDLKASGEVGLKQAYGSDPAEFIPVVEVLFPTKGSYSADTTFLKQHVTTVDVIAKYLDFHY